MMFWKILGCLLVGIAAESATITATPEQNSFRIGDIVPVDIVLSNATDVYAFQFDLLFNPAILSAQASVEVGYFLTNGVSFSPGSIDDTAGRIRFLADALSGKSPTVNGSTTLVTVTLAAIGSGTANVVPTNILLLNSQLSDIPATAVPASINVSASTATPEPSTGGLLLASVATAIIGLYMRRRFKSKYAPQYSA